MIVLNVVQTVDQPHAPDVVILSPDGQIIPAHIGVAVAHGRQHLRQAHAIAQQGPGVEVDMVLFGRAPESGHVDHPGHPFELALQLPILDRLQIRQALPVADEFIPIDLGQRPPGR